MIILVLIVEIAIVILWTLLLVHLDLCIEEFDSNK